MKVLALDDRSRRKKYEEKVDADLLSLFTGAEAVNIPTLLHRSTLKKCGYFESFPNQLLAVGTVHESCYQHVIDTDNVAPEDLNVELMYLTPAACLNIYPMIKKNTQANRVLTTKTPVYRKEKDYIEGLRQTEFTVREFVFLGEPDFVAASLESASEKVLAYARHLSLEASLAGAVDFFYPTKENMLKARFQQRNAQKQELLISIGQDKIACASFNNHGLHFSSSFDFDRGGSITTGCVGFGLERWATAMMNNDKE
ncbi:Amino acid--[acyl-carrier-protein] ligase 1 [compost metagenome]